MFSKMNTVTMATVLFQVTENCEYRENAITWIFMDLLQILHSGAKWYLLGDKHVKCIYVKTRDR